MSATSTSCAACSTASKARAVDALAHARPERQAGLQGPALSLPARLSIPAHRAGARVPLAHQLVLYRCELSGEVADLRACEANLSAQPGADGMARSRTLGRRLRAAGIAGAVYRNAHTGGADSLALFSTCAIRQSAPQARVHLRWDGSALHQLAQVPAPG